MGKWCAILIALLILPAARADLMNSVNYTVDVVIDEAGGESRSTNYILFLEAGQYFHLTESLSYRFCIGFLCFRFGFPAGGAAVLPTVQFLMETAIPGGSADVAYVDTSTTYGTYKPSGITKYIGCLEDPALAQNPTLGIIHAGSQLRYIKLDPGANFALTVSQDDPGNVFVIPVTMGGCSLVREQAGGIPVAPFVPTDDLLNAVELIINYPIDIIGDFEKTGAFTIVLETNQTNITGAPV